MKKNKRIAILGAGITGLAAAHRLVKLGYEVHVFDREKEPGGTCRSFQVDGFTLDYGPHKFYTLVDGVLDQVQSVMGDELMVRDKHQTLFMDGKYFDFPLKMGQMLTRFSPLKSLKILVSYALQLVRNPLMRKEIRSYQDFIVSRFGKGLYQQIFAPMAQKIYGRPEDLDKRLAEVRISSPGLLSVIKNVIFSRFIDKTVSAPQFHYPRKGFGRLPLRFFEETKNLGGNFHLGATLKEILTGDEGVRGLAFVDEKGDHRTLDIDFLVYTIPLPHLKNLMPSLSEEIKSCCDGTQLRNVIIQYYLLKSDPILPSMWVFFPESKYRFGRLSEMTKFSPEVAPPGHTALMVDFTCTDSDPYWKMDDSELDKTLFDQMADLKLFERSAVVKTFSKRIRNFYPVYDIGFHHRLTKLRGLEKQMGNLFFVGRLGDFNYNNSDQCIDMGFKVAEQIDQQGRVNTIWNQLRATRFDQYRIVD